MSKVIYKTIAILALCLSQAARASTATEIANQINTSSTTGGSLTASASGSTVTVTGTLTAVPSSAHALTLNIDAGVTVAWQATLSGTPSSSYALIYINGGSGTFRMTSGRIENTGTGMAIHNNSSGAVNISGGTIKTVSDYAIYNYSPGSVAISGSAVISSTDYIAIYNNNNNDNVSPGTITVSGGTVSSNGSYAIYNYGYLCDYCGTVIVTGGTVSTTTGFAIYNQRGTLTVTGGTVSSTTGYAIYNDATLTISGGTISATTGRAIYTSNGSLTISGNAKITSANTFYGTIDLFNATLNINGGTVENTSTGPAVYNDYHNSIIRVTAGTVRSTGGDAIHNSNNYSWTVNISGGTISTSGSGKSTIYSYSNMSSDATTITGGTLSAPNDGYAFYGIGSSDSLVLGGNPNITNKIYTYPEKMRVITDVENRFAPTSSKIYKLDFPTAQYAVSKIAVMNGKDFLRNFELSNSNYALQTSGNHLSIAQAVKVTFNLNGGSGTPPDTVSVAQGGRIYNQPSTASFTRTGYANDGKWYSNSNGTTEFMFGENGTAVNSNMTLYSLWV